MKFAAALSTAADWGEAVEEIARQLRAGFGAGRADLAVVFVHPRYLADAGELVAGVRKVTETRHLLGCSSTGIIGTQQELENRPAVSVLVGELPRVQITAFQITEKELEESSGPGFWHFQLEVDTASNPSFIVLADPFTIRATELVDALSEAYPGAPFVGGLAGGAEQPGQNRFFLDEEIVDEGAVGVALSGEVQLRAVVSQGCRPIGWPLVVTRAEKNIVFELGGVPPVEVLRQMLPKLPVRDQQLVRSALFLGRVVNEYKEEYRRGDFLIRNLIGSDPQTGALAVGDWVRTGQTVQFQVRDAESADEDLRELLGREKRAMGASAARAVLLFSCLGRGQGMYGVPHHDIRVIQRMLGPVPAAGMFCNGEIGPVGERAFVHGFTSVVGLFTEPAAS
jgi:small ligand-binding sensory domain FIST